MNEAIGFFIFKKRWAHQYVPPEAPVLIETIAANPPGTVFINATQNVFKINLYSQYAVKDIWKKKNCLDSLIKGCDTSSFI